MAESEFTRGFTVGWLAASEAIAKAISNLPESPTSLPSLDMAGNLPSLRRRGRPPKAASMLAPEPVKRGPGRPRKAR